MGTARFALRHVLTAALSSPEVALNPLPRAHMRRLRQIYRSAGWPCHDAIEVDLLAAKLLDRVFAPTGHESLRLTDAGLHLLSQSLNSNRAARSQHDALVERVAVTMARSGRLVWCGLGLRVPLVHETHGTVQWSLARPDVFSICNTSVARYLEPVVHEVKVNRSDLLADMRRPPKRAAYLGLGQCWYVLGLDSRSKPIGEPEEIPAECGVMIATPDRLMVARAAAHKPAGDLPFHVWMALAKAGPAYAPEEDAQGLLGEVDLPLS